MKTSWLLASSILFVQLQAGWSQDGGGIGHELAVEQETPLSEAHRRLATTSPGDHSADDDHSTGDTHTACDTAHAADAAHDAHAAHETHQQDALLFLFNALLVGVAVMHTACYLSGLQESVVLFVLGMTYSLIQEGLGFKDDSDKFGASYDMWMSIDPHLLLFAMLPVLLMGDAMTIDTNVAKVVAKQCIFLAGPGVLLNAFAVAGFLMWYLDWEFLLSLTTGAILCATDPVAVVALLKELGASPTLTVQIQGESLLNDGTAIVVYTVAYNMLSGVDYETDDLVLFLVKTAIMAFGLGGLIGYVFFLWMQLANHLTDHRSDMIQIALSLCCAYWSFIIAEGVLEISGVLSTVGAALVLADNMWPHIKSKATMLHVWHTFEFLGNTVIFFLGGALVGNAMIDIEYSDYLHLVVLYVYLTLCRGVTVFASRPLLRMLHAEGEAVTAADAAVITWGGLRGAVGLALAIQVFNGRAEDENGVPRISETEAQRVLFFVGGIAFLTTIVNAPTCPFLVSYLELTALPAARLKLLRMLHRELSATSESQEDLPTAVLHSVRHVLNDAQNAIERQATKQEQALAAKLRRSVQGIHSASMHIGWGHSHQVAPMKQAAADELQMDEHMTNVLKKFREARDNATNLKGAGADSGGFKSLWHLPRSPHAEDLENCIMQGGTHSMDKDLQKVLNEAFMYLVRSKYYGFMEEGELQPGSTEAKMLLHGVQMGLSHLRDDINDYEFVAKNLDAEEDLLGTEGPSFVRKSGRSSARSDTSKEQKKSKGCCARCCRARHYDEQPGCVEKVCESITFQVLVVLVLLINGVVMLIEEHTTDDDDQTDKPVWLIFDIVFTSVFLLEFSLKFGYQRVGYFLDGWNVFDFVLVSLGLLGVAVSVLSHSVEEASQGDVSSEARLVRLSRVFRVMRLLRLFRLIKFIKVIRMRLRNVEYSPELASSMVTIQTLRHFILAHVDSQIAFVKYFGPPSRTMELCRVLIQSQTQVYQAIVRAAEEEKRIDPEVLPTLNHWLESKDCTREMVEHVAAAHELSIITGREAHTMIHPLEHHVEKCNNIVWDAAQGVHIRESEHEMNTHDVIRFSFKHYDLTRPSEASNGNGTASGNGNGNVNGHTTGVRGSLSPASSTLQDIADAGEDSS